MSNHCNKMFTVHSTNQMIAYFLNSMCADEVVFEGGMSRLWMRLWMSWVELHRLSQQFSRETFILAFFNFLYRSNHLPSCLVFFWYFEIRMDFRIIIELWVGLNFSSMHLEHSSYLAFFSQMIQSTFLSWTSYLSHPEDQFPRIYDILVDQELFPVSYNSSYY